ncbi:hypothetical protein G3A43_06835 [Paraburkholderia aspalathi]|nr:hypothetical protein [Paraburkholderia aspalathi]MBK3779966.1 hypothetical protein [Paraburkholderia aspalathi]
MGEAKRRRDAAAARGTELLQATARVGNALKKLATAASSHLGSDCYMHAVLGRELLADFGFQARVAVGEAAWRVGDGDGDVVTHTPRVKGFVPEGKKGLGYHAWLVVDGHIVDFTTYQLDRKAKELDAADGGHTSVTWAPDPLVLPVGLVLSLRQVAQSARAGVVFYDAHPELLQLVSAEYEIDEGDLANARLLVANPDIRVFGPNDVRDRDSEA